MKGSDVVRTKRVWALALSFVSAVAASAAQAEDYVVFLLAGQSNMSGRAAKSGLPMSLQSAQTDVRIYYGGDAGTLPRNSWQNLQPGTGTDIGPEITLGRWLADAYPERRIAFIKHADGGTSLAHDWNPNSPGPIYAAFLNTVDAGLAALTAEGHTWRIGGMYWLQGEEDSNHADQAAAYEGNLLDFMADVRVRFNEPKLPFIVGRIAPSTRPYFNQVRAAQVAAAEADPYSIWVDLDGAPRNSIDPIHFNATGYQAIGKWFADAWKPQEDIGGYNSNPKLASGVVNNVGTSWHTVSLPQNYSRMVVVATVNYDRNKPPVVARVRNASGSSFQVRVQNPSDSSVSGYTVHYVVVEAGRYKTPKLEAGRITSNVTDRTGSMSGQRITYRNTYTRPVVLGQVMSDADPDWSVFWARGAGGGHDAPDARIYIGKHVGEDTDTTRNDETLGYIILESGSGTLDGVAYTAGVGADIVQGIANQPGINYPISGLSSAKVAILGMAGNDGNDPGWPLLYGTTPVSTSQLNVAIDEDTIGDAERLHPTEQVSYLVLANGSTTTIPPNDPVTLAFEAENFSSKSSGTGAASGISWQSTTATAGHSGASAMTTNSNTDVSVGDKTIGPRMDYSINFPAAGTYYVWVRMFNPSTPDDSLHAGLLNSGPASFGGNGLGGKQHGQWAWYDKVSDTRRVTISVTSAGTQTFSIWMREDGVVLDRVILTQDATFVPQDDGGGDPPPPVPTEIVVQAEDYVGAASGTGAATGKTWQTRTWTAGFTGSSAMQAVPETGLNVGDTTDGPRMDYLVDFPEAGTYYAWVRVYAHTGSEDSLHLGLLSQGPATFGAKGYAFAEDAWRWTNSTATRRVTLNITSAGTHTVSIWMREDGTLVDKLLFTKDAGYTPQ